MMMENCGVSMAVADSNNNNTIAEKCEKYSLRPRTVVKREDEEFEAWKPRSKCKKRQKQKPAPLSKYRRKTANARERCRMREINDGFEALRRVLPQLETDADSTEKLTKISTLRLAMKYIQTLNRILRDPSADVESDVESFFGEYATSTTTSDVSDQSSLTPPAAFSDTSLCTDFSDQLLSPSDFADSILPSTCDLDIASLPLANDFSLSDFVNVPSSASSSCSLSSSSSTISDLNLDTCLPEIHFDTSEYPFDSLGYMSNFS